MLKILLVDDNPGDRQLFKDTLIESGIKHDLIECSSASNAFVKSTAEKPDIIFMDINMPKINGADYVRSLRNDPQMSAIPVIFLTGIVDRAQKKDLNIGGLMFAALGKPVNAGDLRSAIQEALNSK